MALGAGGSGPADSLLLTITSGVAIGVVVMLVILLFILRARHAARTRSEMARMVEEMEKKLTVRVLSKPTFHEVRVARTNLEHPASLRSISSNVNLQHSEKVLGTVHEWDKVMVSPLYMGYEGLYRSRDQQLYDPGNKC
jgi:hypothetical protein